MSRNLDKLSTVSSQIQATYPNTEVKIFPLDFTTTDLVAGIIQLEKFLKRLDVGLVINNVGLSYPWAKYFHEVEEEAWMSLVKVNVEGTTRVTRAVLPGMVKRRSAIVYIGSGAAAVIPSHPFYAVYAATKAYVDQLSRSLYVEYKSYGIDVQCQVPLYIATKMAEGGRNR